MCCIDVYTNVMVAKFTQEQGYHLVKNSSLKDLFMLYSLLFLF